MNVAMIATVRAGSGSANWFFLAGAGWPTLDSGIVAGDEVVVRELAGIADMIAAASLWDTIWARTEAGHEVDPALLVALSHAGGYVAAAFESDTMIGAAVGFWGSPRQLTLHSHITGVLPDYAGRGVGFLIKNHQSDWVLSRGGTAITWTYDPLVARNAYFNLARLGARPERYLPDAYGELTDVLNRGDPSDRLMVRWSLTQPPPASSGPAVPLITVDDGEPVLGPNASELNPAAALTVAVPEDISVLRRKDPATASRWRHAVRNALAPRMELGWRITGFDRRHGYRLEPPPTAPTDGERP